MQNPTNGRLVGAPEPPSVVPNAAQLSREAKHMRVMLMLCVKEKVFDQTALESIFSQWLLCEQQNEGHVEETDAAFRRSLGRTYGPRSKDFLGAIDRAKVKLEQLKERKRRGELGSGGSIGVPPPNLPPSSMGNPQIGMPRQMGGQIGGQPLSNQPPAQMMSHQSLGQMPHLAQPQQPPAQPHLTQQHPRHPRPPQRIGQPTKSRMQQTLQQKQQQHQPPLQQSHLGLEAQTCNLAQSSGSTIIQLNFRQYSFHNCTSAYYDLTSDEGDNAEESLPPRKRQKVSVESPSIFSEECIVEGLLQQYECAICFEVMACAYCISPCGDCFCYECLEEWAGQSKKSCPQCRGRFDLKRAIPMKRIDNAIRETLKHRTEQLAAWEKRVEEGLKKQKA